MARLIFMGTPEFAVPTLQALAEAGHEIAAVYTQPPRPAGRGQKPRPSPVAAAASALGLPIFTPASLKSGEEHTRFAAWRADAAIVAAYGLILPPEILAAPAWGCINLHASLLPRWRGAAPLHRAIMAGDTETGLSVMQMEAGLDTGPVWLQKRVPIHAGTTTGQLHDILAAAGGALMNDALAGIAAGRLTATPQSETGVKYADKISKSESRIDWAGTAEQVRCHIHGLSPWPGAFTYFGKHRLKILAVKADSSGNSLPAGQIFHNREAVGVACGQGAVLIERLQRDGRQPMTIDKFQNGMPLPDGALLS